MSLIKTNQDSWTVLSPGTYQSELANPGQTFEEHELPHPEVQRAAGLKPAAYREAHGLYITSTEKPHVDFVGSETGLSPELSALTGHAESFLSVTPDSKVAAQIAALEPAPVYVPQVTYIEE